MNVSVHIFFGLFFSIILFLIFPQIGIIGAIIIWLSNFLIDVDHYFYYIFIKKNWSLPKAYRWHSLKKYRMQKLSKKERLKHKNEILFLHGLEPLVVAYLLSLIWKPFIFLFIGFCFHLILDIYYEITITGRLDKVSVIWDTIKFKKLKQLEEIIEYAKDNTDLVGFIHKFSTLKLEQAKELRQKIKDLNLLKLNSDHIAKIIDLVPTTNEELNRIFTDLNLDEDESKQILDATKEYK